MCITLLVSEAALFSAVVVVVVVTLEEEEEEKEYEEVEDEEEVRQEQEQGDLVRRNAWTRSCNSSLLLVSWRVWEGL
jgi:hypothetical protein